MPNPTENLDWAIICPELLEGLVDAVRLCSLQVKHPLCLRKNQRPQACGIGCNDSRNLAKLANELVNIVITNHNYVKILHWRCTVCHTPNIGSVTCTTCPKDPFKNSPLYNLLAKHFSQFFKSLVSLISSNPPTNYAPSKVIKFSFIVTILTSHGQKWHALLPINHKMSYNCTCKPPPASPPTESPPKDLLEDDDDDMLHLNCSSESLYEVRKISLPHLTNNGHQSKLFLIHINTQSLITAKIIIVPIQLEMDNLISQDLLVLEADDQAANTIAQQEEMERNANRQELPHNNRGAAGGAVLAPPHGINKNMVGRQLGAIPKVAYQ